MKVLVSTTFILYIAFVIAEEYTSKFDNIDLKAILANDRLVQNYADCLTDKGNCTPEGTELKSHIKEALESNCAKCSDKHKEGVRTVFNFLAKNKPDILKTLVGKYDPDGLYRKNYEDLLKKEGITL